MDHAILAEGRLPEPATAADDVEPLLFPNDLRLGRMGPT
jgi:hypothetical protein